MNRGLRTLTRERKETRAKQTGDRARQQIAELRQRIHALERVVDELVNGRAPARDASLNS